MRSVLFFPYDPKKPLTRQYPELGRAREFKDLTTLEQLFVWRFACKSSPLFADERMKSDNKARAKAAFEQVWVKANYDAATHEDYCNLNFPEHIKVAVDWMSKKSPDIRSQALLASENQFAAMIEMMNEPVPEKEDAEDEEGNPIKVPITLLAKKQHIEARQKAREEMTQLIAVIEEGYGVNLLDSGIGDDEYTIANYIRELRQHRKS